MGTGMKSIQIMVFRQSVKHLVSEHFRYILHTYLQQKNHWWSYFDSFPMELIASFHKILLVCNISFSFLLNCIALS